MEKKGTVEVGYRVVVDVKDEGKNSQQFNAQRDDSILTMFLQHNPSISFKYSLETVYTPFHSLSTTPTLCL